MDSIITKILDPFPYLRIDNMYSDEELELISDELIFLNHKEKMEEPLVVGSAKDSNGNPLKKNIGISLDTLYKRREISNILKVNRKLFNKEYLNAYSDLNFGYRSIKECDSDFTLISYYENGGYYKQHKDKSIHTALTWFYKEPKLFDGGNLYFSEYNEEIEVKHNTTILFPSFVLHEVKEIKMKNDVPYGFGRYCMSQFIHIGTND